MVHQTSGEGPFWKVIRYLYVQSAGEVLQHKHISFVRSGSEKSQHLFFFEKNQHEKHAVFFYFYRLVITILFKCVKGELVPKLLHLLSGLRADFFFWIDSCFPDLEGLNNEGVTT